MKKIIVILLLTATFSARMTAQSVLKSICNLDICCTNDNSENGPQACGGAASGCLIPYVHTHIDAELQHAYENVYVLYNMERQSCYYYGYMTTLSEEFFDNADVASENIEMLPNYQYYILQYNDILTDWERRFSKVDERFVTQDIYEKMSADNSKPSFSYTYSADNRMESIKTKSSDGEQMEWRLKWQDGNIVSGTLYIEDNEVGSFECQYNDRECENQAAVFSTPLYELLNISRVNAFMLIMDKRYGQLCRNYLQSITFDIPQDDLCRFMPDYLEKPYTDHDYTYVFNDDGYPVAIADNKTNSTVELKWVDVLDIKDANLQQTRIDSAIYDLQGRRLSSAPRHGVFIENGRKNIGK